MELFFFLPIGTAVLGAMLLYFIQSVSLLLLYQHNPRAHTTLEIHISCREAQGHELIPESVCSNTGAHSVIYNPQGSILK